MTTLAVSKHVATAESKTAGLTSSEAAIRLEKDGPNAMPDTSAHPFAMP